MLGDRAHLQQEDGQSAETLQSVFRIVTWKLCLPWSVQRSQVLPGAGMEAVSGIKCYVLSYCRNMKCIE